MQDSFQRAPSDEVSQSPSLHVYHERPQQRDNQLGSAASQIRKQQTEVVVATAPRDNRSEFLKREIQAFLDDKRLLRQLEEQAFSADNEAAVNLLRS